MTLTSSEFVDGSKIPRRHTCEGADLSPQLSWSRPSAATQSLVLIVDDPDAPDPRAPKMTFVHWVVYNIPAGVTELPAGVTRESLPPPALVGINDFKRAGWGGPCPPIGRHRYVFKLYALDAMLPNLGSGVDPATKRQVEDAMHGHVLAEAQLVGTYQKGDD